MSKRFITTLLAAVFTTNCLCSTALTAHAFEPTPPWPTYPGPSLPDWGVNRDGWNVTVKNDSPNTFTYIKRHSLQIYAIPAVLSGHEQTTAIRGNISWVTNNDPADIRVVFADNTLDARHFRYLRITATTTGDVTATCGTATYFGKIQTSTIEFDSCMVTKQNRNEPIEVTFTS